VREVHALLAIRRSLIFRFGVGDLGVVRDVGHESVDGCEKMKACAAFAPNYERLEHRFYRWVICRSTETLNLIHTAGPFRTGILRASKAQLRNGAGANMLFVKFLMILLGLAVPGTTFAVAQQPQARASQYVVGGLALGGRVRFDASAYRDYQCDPSEQFDGFTWCQKATREQERRGSFDVSFTLLHAADGSAFYINRYQAPAFWDANEVTEDIERYSRKIGERPRTISMPKRDGLPNGIIALWGNVRLEPLDAASRRIVAEGRSPKKGILVDFIGNLVRSAREDLPLYRIDGEAGFVWVASFDQRGRGTLRFSAVDASAFMPRIARPQVPTPPNPGANGSAPAPQRPPEQAVSSGTGFFVSTDGHVLTNHHVIEDCVSVKIERPGIGTTNAVIVARDKSNDLALLRSSERPTVIPTFRSQLKLGENIFVFGFPLTGLLSSMGNFALGTVTALAGLRDDSGLVQISASV
jgi:hypothetical protein